MAASNFTTTIIGASFTGATTIVATILSVLSYCNEQLAGEQQLELEIARRDHEVRSFYFKAAVKGEPEGEDMRKRVLRYLERAGSHEPGASELRAWAERELKLMGVVQTLDAELQASKRQVREQRKRLRLSRLVEAQTFADDFAWHEDPRWQTMVEAQRLESVEAQANRTRRLVRNTRIRSGLDMNTPEPELGDDPLLPLLGRWQGTVGQADENPYEVVVELEYGGEQDIIGTSYYYYTVEQNGASAESCWGQLTRVTSFGGMVEAQEQVIVGLENCVNGGTMQFKLLKPSVLEWRYFHPNGNPDKNSYALMHRPTAADIP